MVEIISRKLVLSLSVLALAVGIFLLPPLTLAADDHELTAENAAAYPERAEIIASGNQINVYRFPTTDCKGLSYYDAAPRHYQTSLELYNDPYTFHHCRDALAGNYCGGLNLGPILPELVASVQGPGRSQRLTAQQVAGQPSNVSSEPSRTSNTLQFSVPKRVDAVDREIYGLVVRSAGKVVYKGESVLRDPAPRLLENTPTTGFQTNVAETWSGGAHCCSDGVIAITCGSAKYLYSIYLGNSGGGPGIMADVDGDGVKELALADEAFVYYTADARHSLSYADSVKLTRYAVWTSQGWRVTGPGELRMAYLKLKNQALSERMKGQFETANAIEITYYALMSGEDAQKTRRQLESLLPRDWKSISNKVFKDLQSSVSKTPIDPDTKKSVITTIMKTSALNKRGGTSAFALSQ